MTRPTPDRRTLLGTLAGVGASSLAGCPLFSPGADGTATPLGPQRSRSLASQFAPTLYFDEHEQWFPTDPRPYTSQRGGDTIVTGFDALNGYHDRFTGSTPPNPTVFYNAVSYEESPLAVVQFWFYSVFDQFTQALDAVADAARRAAEAAGAGDRSNADRRLDTVASRLQQVRSNLEDASGDLSAPLSAAASKRLDQAATRTEQARGQSKL